MKTALRARLKKCVSCGQAKPLTEYANPLNWDVDENGIREGQEKG